MRWMLIIPVALMPSISWAQAIGSAQNATPPAPAAAAGYKVQTLGGGVWPELPWVKFDFNGTDTNAINVQFHGDGTVTIAGGGNGYNAQLSTAHMGGKDSWMGVAYGNGGYFEATLSIDGKDYKGYGTPGSNGWPAWWSNDIEKTTGQAVDGYEPDFMEYWSPTHFGYTIHYWGDPNSGKSGELASANLPPTYPARWRKLVPAASVRVPLVSRRPTRNRVRPVLFQWQTDPVGTDHVEKK